MSAIPRLEQTTALALTPQAIEAGACQLLTNSKLLNANGLAARKSLLKNQKDGFNLRIVFVADGTLSMEPQVDQINTGVTQWVETFMKADLGPETQKVFGGKFSIGGAVIVYGDIDEDPEPFKLIPVEPVPLLGGSNPFSPYLRAFKTAYDGGPVGKGESFIETMLLALGRGPDGKPTLVHGAVDSILTELRVDREAMRKAGYKYGTGEVDYTQEYYNVLKYLPPQLIIAMTDDLAKTPRTYPIVPENKKLNLEVWTQYTDTPQISQTGGISYAGTTVNANMRNEYINGPLMSFDSLRKALEEVGGPAVCILTPDKQIPNYTNGGKGELIALKTYYEAAGIGRWMDINNLNGIESPISNLLSRTAYTQLAQSLPMLNAPV